MRRLAILSILWVALGPFEVGAQADYGNRFGQVADGRLTYPTQGVYVQMEALDPTVMRWYLPQELYAEYGRNQSHYTNYARRPFRRYLDPNQEGNNFYDAYGNFITRGWRIYDWRQSQPATFESSGLTKDGRYVSWFNRLIIASDAGGDYSYSVIIGDEIRTTLTPLTFRKAGYNGIVTSLAGGRSRFTGISSRLSAPLIDAGAATPTIFLESFTNLTGGRAEFDLSGNITLGATFVNAHTINGTRKSFSSNPFKGQLTAGQLSQRLNFLAVRLSDDSPEDGEGGAVLFGDDVEFTTTLMREVVQGDTVRMVPRDTVIVGSSIGFRAQRLGGEVKGGFLRADGPDNITLRYVLAPVEGEEDLGSLRLRLQQALNLSLSAAEDVISAIKNVRFRLLLANDYRVEVTSDRQANVTGTAHFLPVTRAEGNIKSQLNQRQVVFDYGLPTANQIFGFSTRLKNLWGFDGYGEFNINHQYRQYPNGLLKKHRSFSGVAGDEAAIAFVANLSRQVGAVRLFGEAFGMDDAYQTSLKPVDGRGLVDYDPLATNRLYDLVEDNDDQDRHPDQLRQFHGSLIPPRTTTRGNFQIQPQGQADPAVFPGYDENNDFISDFNQNSTFDREDFFPDYEEPFLRHNTDRPEFLFGMDMNNNGWVDRFENDNEPDYPYPRDHWGYNAFATATIAPRVEISVGHLDQHMRQVDRQSKSTYALFAGRRDLSGWGQLRLFDMVRRVEDNIPDHLLQWLVPEPRFGEPGQSSGSNQPVTDRLAAEDTWINTLYLDWSYQSPRLWRMVHKLKWEVWEQADTDKVLALDAAGNALLDADGQPVVEFDPLGPQGRNGRASSGFFGLINKADWQYDLGPLQLQPRFKSEILRRVPFGRDQEKRRSWDLIPSLLVEFPILKATRIQMGWEQRQFFNLRDDEDKLDEGSPTGDFSGTVLALQLSNKRKYLGYELTTLMGLRYDRRSLERVGLDDEKRTAGLAFLALYASLRE